MKKIKITESQLKKLKNLIKNNSSKKDNEATKILKEQFQKLSGINEQAFNKDNEPLMTHSQFRDYSEPSEPEYNDDSEFEHFSSNKTPFSYMNRIDWDTLYDYIKDNTIKNINKDVVRGNKKYINNNQIIEDTGISDEELRFLNTQDIIDNDGHFSFFDVLNIENIPNFKTFMNSIRNALNNPKNNSHYNDNSSEEPYMRGKELNEQDSSQEPNEIINGFNDFPPHGHADEQDPSKNIEEKPDWLETLWNVNPRLAERAEEYLKEKGILSTQNDEESF